MMYFTTSWDDGDVLDMRLAGLLDKYGVKGTFYITEKYRKDRLRDDEIRVIAKHHEIGAHTKTHPDLRRLSTLELEREVAGSKVWLESILGKEVPMFCYPSGHYNDDAVASVRAANFQAARTTTQGVIHRGGDPFQMATTLHIYPLPLRKLPSGGYWWGNLFEPVKQRYGVLRRLSVPPWRMYRWRAVAKAAFDHAYAHGDLFHLWGHSWEVNAFNMWDDLGWFLQYAIQHKGIRFVTNQELL